MEKSRRVQKVEKELRQVVSQYILTRLKDFSSVIHSVSHVQASPDLRSSKVYVSGLNGEPDIEWLQSHSKDIQREISRNLRMKFCPKLTFYKDESSERILKIEKALHKISLEREES